MTVLSGDKYDVPLIKKCQMLRCDPLHLKEALKERTPRLIFLKTWPIFENLHPEPDFKSLLGKICS